MRRTSSFWILSLAILAGCASFNFDSALGATSVAIETLANRVVDACKAAEPGAPCAPAPVGLISSETRDRMKASLQAAHDSYAVAVQARIAGDMAGATGSLEAASTILDALEAELTRRVME